MISLLVFADNTLVLCEPNEDQLAYLCCLLMWFEALFGLKINLENSEIILVSSLVNNVQLAQEFRCTVGAIPSSLGLPLGALSKCVSNWFIFKERCVGG